MDKPNPEFRPVDQTDEPRNVLTPVESRGGIMTGRVRWVLAISLALVVIAFVSLYAVRVGSDGQSHAQTHSITASG